MARTVVPTNQFKRDIKKQYMELITPQWVEVMNCLINDLPLAVNFRNHALTGDKKHLMDCHVKPDLVLLTPAVKSVYINLGDFSYAA